MSYQHLQLSMVVDRSLNSVALAWLWMCAIYWMALDCRTDSVRDYRHMLAGVIKLTFDISTEGHEGCKEKLNKRNILLTSFRDTLDTGKDVVKSMSASISDISSEKPFGNDVSPVFEFCTLLVLSSSFVRCFCINRRPITMIRHRRMPAVIDIIQ